MSTVVMSQDELQAFGKKLEEFGNGLAENEQRLLAEILLRAASAQSDVEGHTMGLSASWPEVRQRVGALLGQVIESMAVLSPYQMPDRAY